MPGRRVLLACRQAMVSWLWWPVLKRMAKGARRWIALADGVPGHGRRLFELVAVMDLEGVVAERLADPYAPGRTIWFKILNPAYSRKEGRSVP